MANCETDCEFITITIEEYEKLLNNVKKSKVKDENKIPKKRGRKKGGKNKTHKDKPDRREYYKNYYEKNKERVREQNRINRRKRYAKIKAEREKKKLEESKNDENV